MSAVFLNVGQCGNQLAQSFWQEVEEWTTRNSKNTSSRPSLSASSRVKVQPQATGRPSGTTSGSASIKKSSYLPYSLLSGTLPCLWVDTEPKVIKSYRSNSTKSSSSLLSGRIASDCCIVLPEGSGRGSNWAYGYDRRIVGRSTKPVSALTGRDEGKLTVKSVEEKMRKMVERCDRFGGTVLMHSLAGGTGSGLSSALLESVRDNYPLAYILSISIAPFSYGDTPLQHYNSLLCLSWLQTYCDGVLLLQNDTILNQAQQLLLESKGSGGGGGASRGKRPGGGREGALRECSVSLADMNKRISQVLCNSFMPIWSAKQSSPSYACQEPWELVRSLCPDPKLKFITPFHTESSRYSWDQPTTYLLDPRLVRRKPTQSGESVKTSTLSLVFIARGSPNSITSSLVKGTNLTTLEGKLKDVYNTVRWNPFPVDFWFSHEVQLVDRKLATVLVNGSIVCDYLDSVVEKASMMYQEQAYLHWYKKYGCEEDTFKEAFDTTQTIIDNYTSLK